jgi:hypothetical protein
MQRFIMSTITMLALTSFMAPTLRADSPHFIKGPTISFDSATGDLCVTFKEAGLGSSPITYTISVGTETFTFQCFTKSDNTPQGDPNSISISNVSEPTTITPHNGQISATLCLVPQQDGASCQGGGLRLKLLAATYKDVVFCDSTNNICTSFEGTFGGPLDKPIIFP